MTGWKPVLRGTKLAANVLRPSDMQRTVRILRIALPIVFIAFVVFIFASWNRAGGRKSQPSNGPVTSTQRPEDRPQAEARAFRDVQTIGGRVVSEIVAARVVSFESGWTTLEGVTLTLYRANGLTYVISCPEAQFNSETKAAEAKGGVRVSSSDGVEIRTAQIHYDGTRLTNDIPVQFRIDRWTGDAGALDLNVQDETLRLHKNVRASMAPPPGEAAMTIAAPTGVFKRRDNLVEFSEKAVMTRGADRLAANLMVGRFTEDRTQLIGMQGIGETRIVMADNTLPGEDLGGRKEITADSFTTEVGPDGRIGAINLNSAENPARAILDGPPKRDIVARSFRVALQERAVSEIRADWQVVMKELGPETRQINAEHVTVWFDPATRRARSAYLEGAFRYKDPRTTASAFRANYDIAGDRIVLTTDPGWQATVVTDGNILRAKQIEFAPRGQTARATGAVIAQLASRGKTTGASADTTGLFPAGQPVFVNSDALFMQQQDRIAHFTGNVKAWQDKNTILAQEMQVQGSGDTIIARGGVRTLLYNSGSETRQTPMQSSSEQIIARRVERRVELTGNVTLQDETRTLKSKKATLFLDTNRKVERMEAEEDVTLAETATGRKGSADRAVYDVTAKTIRLFGSPAKISDPTGAIEAQQILFDIARNNVKIVSEEGQTKGTFKNEE